MRDALTDNTMLCLCNSHLQDGSGCQLICQCSSSEVFSESEELPQPYQANISAYLFYDSSCIMTHKCYLHIQDPTVAFTSAVEGKNLACELELDKR